jgi:hypothetical protein
MIHTSAAQKLHLIAEEKLYMSSKLSKEILTPKKPKLNAKSSKHRESQVEDTIQTLLMKSQRREESNLNFGMSSKLLINRG